MRLWHIDLIPYLDRQRLLSQHRECCALRGKGWGKKHATVDYVFSYSPAALIVYHYKVMKEMKRRGYKPDSIWMDPCYRGKILGEDTSFVDAAEVADLYNSNILFNEHDGAYFEECVRLLKEKMPEFYDEEWDREVFHQ